MKQQFQRTALLLGEEAVDTLKNKRVAVFGIGGVGGYVCEALVRSGIGAFDLIDSDVVDITNLNRQIIATHSTISRRKVDVMKERMLDINPEVEVRTWNTFFLPANASGFPFEEYDYVVDAVDTVSAKIELILRAKEMGIPVISAMGAGNKLDASAMKVADIYKTSGCPLAKVMRRELKRRGVKELKVVYSEEPPRRPRLEKYEKPDLSEAVGTDNPVRSRKSIMPPGSTAFVPAVCGLIMAGEVVKDLSEYCSVSKEKDEKAN